MKKATLVAGAVLVLAIAGTAIAGPSAIKSALTKSKVKKIANKEIKKAAPGLSVANANTVGNVPLSGIASVAQGTDSNCDPNTGAGTFDDCVGTTINTTRTADIVVTVTGVWFDAGAEPVEGQCRIERNGTAINSDASYGIAGAVDVTGNGTAEQPLSMTDVDADRPAGSYTYNLACEENTADFSMEDISTTAMALGS